MGNGSSYPVTQGRGTMAMVATLLAGSPKVQVHGRGHFSVPAHKVMDHDPPTSSCCPFVVLTFPYSVLHYIRPSIKDTLGDPVLCWTSGRPFCHRRPSLRKTTDKSRFHRVSRVSSSSTRPPSKCSARRGERGGTLELKDRGNGDIDDKQ